MFFRKFLVLCGCAFLLSGCGGGGGASSTESQPPIVTATLDGLLTSEGGLSNLFADQNTADLDYVNYKSGSIAAFVYNRSSKVFEPSTSQVNDVGYTRWILSDSGVWESKTYKSDVDEILTKQPNGKYTTTMWFGGQVEHVLLGVEDVSGKPVNQHVPFMALLKSGMSIKAGATFASGSLLATVIEKQLVDSYMVNDWAGIQVASIAEWLTAADTGVDVGGVSVNLSTFTPGASTGTYIATTGGVAYEGAWQKKTIGTTDVIVLLGGSKDKQIFWQNSLNCHPLIGVIAGSERQGVYCAANNVPYGYKTYSAGFMNQPALSSILTSLEKGPFFGYGTPVSESELKTLLAGGVNYVYPEDGTLRVDRNQLVGATWKNNNRYGLNLQTLTFDFDSSIPNSGPNTNIVLDGLGGWGSLVVYSTAQVQSDATLLQTANTWNRGEIVSSYNTVDLDGTPVLHALGLLSTTSLSGGFIPEGKLFSAGAKFISHRFVQKTTGYQLWGWYTGHTSLSDAVNNTSFDMWLGKSVQFVFPVMTQGATAGKVTVKDAQNTYGQADWSRKLVNGVEMIVITNLPVGSFVGDYTKQNPILSVFNGNVSRGMEILAGQVIDVSSSLVLNTEAATQMAASVQKY